MSSLWSPNIFLSTLFSDTLGLHSSLIVSNQVSHPYKTTGKIIVLCILIFIFSDSWCVQFNFKPSRFTWTLLMAYFKAVVIKHLLVSNHSK
jgi:uncharacterized integral membrane protein